MTIPKAEITRRNHDESYLPYIHPDVQEARKGWSQPSSQGLTQAPLVANSLLGAERATLKHLLVHFP